MNIDEMPAGREMDALILRDIFGATVEWQDAKQSKSSSSPAGFYGTFPDNLAKCYDPGGHSTDIAATWQVVEELHKNDWWSSASYQYIRHYVRHKIPNPNQDWGYLVEFHKMTDHNISVWGIADLLPLAICRAALKAVVQS